MKKKFKDYVKERKKSKVKNNPSLKDTPLDQQKHHLKSARGIDRQSLNQVPEYRRDAHKTDLIASKNILETAKKATSGIWKLSGLQARELASKYKFNLPTTGKKRSKHLGSTGIVMWRRDKVSMYLVNFDKHMQGK